jgi:prepilin-type N-terminal cleavage/methylation domain-containing protein
MQLSGRTKAFTLLELSIVIVVMGLFMGAVMAGKSVLRASKLRGAMAETQRFTQAIVAFQEKYQAMPGDFAAASTTWAGTGDGDGDGRVVVYANAVPVPNEQYLVWKHLAKAGLLTGSYTGAAGAPATGAVLEQNVPESEVTSGGWQLFFNNADEVGGGLTMSFTTVSYNHYLLLHEPEEGEAAISPSEGKLIDTKIDDGIASTGNVGQVAAQNTEWTSSDSISAKLVVNTGL